MTFPGLALFDAENGLMSKNNLCDPLPYSIDCEVIPPDEGEEIQSVLQMMRSLLERKQAKTGLFQSDVHVKSNGCAQGEFRVLPNLPPELAQGLFRRDRSFPATVRFSNSSSEIQPDWIPDGRGMAIQIRDVAVEIPSPEMVSLGGERSQTQDFIMINHPVFFARNVKDFLRLEKVLVDANGSPIATLQGALTGGDWNPLNWHWREALTAAQIATHLPAHPAGQTYYSLAPIRFGQYVAKYRMKPAGELTDSFVDVVSKLGRDANGLRLMLEETLRKEQVLFEFQVQLRTSSESMPIEDVTIEWPESESPFRTVAHLLLPRQEIATPELKEAGRNLSFNVWHALEEHRPLGGINRLRKEAYQVSYRWRQGATETAR